MLCLSVNYFNHFRFSKGNPELDSRVVWRRCAREVTAKWSAFTDRENTNSDFCPALLERSAAIGVCVLRETGHASGDILNRTAVMESIERQAERVDDPTQHLERMGVYQCKGDWVDSFVRCWILGSSNMALIRMSYELTMALPQPAPVWL